MLTLALAAAAAHLAVEPQWARDYEPLTEEAVYSVCQTYASPRTIAASHEIAQLPSGEMNKALMTRVRAGMRAQNLDPADEGSVLLMCDFYLRGVVDSAKFAVEVTRPEPAPAKGLAEGVRLALRNR